MRGKGRMTELKPCPVCGKMPTEETVENLMERFFEKPQPPKGE